MREETRPVLGAVLGLLAAVAVIWWGAGMLDLWYRAHKNPAIYTGPGAGHVHTMLTTLYGWSAAVLAVGALILVASVLLIVAPRFHNGLGAMLLILSIAAIGIAYAYPFGIGRQELYAGLIAFPALGIIGGIAGLAFRSDLEFARSYGLD